MTFIQRSSKIGDRKTLEVEAYNGFDSVGNVIGLLTRDKKALGELHQFGQRVFFTSGENDEIICIGQVIKPFGKSLCSKDEQSRENWVTLSKALNRFEETKWFSINQNGKPAIFGSVLDKDNKFGGETHL
ncbi:UNVERIFIED_CONTAM: hypothetical protein Sindi_2466500 [Sesamum indicum]